MTYHFQYDIFTTTAKHQFYTKKSWKVRLLKHIVKEKTETLLFVYILEYFFVNDELMSEENLSILLAQHRHCQTLSYISVT